MKKSFGCILSSLCALLTAWTLFYPATARAASKDACSLITSAEAQLALGEPVGPPQGESRSFGSGEGSACKFRSTIGKPFSAKTIELTAHYSGTDLTGSANGIAESLRSNGFRNVRDVPGVGSAAIWGIVPGARPQAELTVLQGKSVMLIILITGVSDENAALDRARLVANKALSRL